jgi:hypothetical protein
MRGTLRLTALAALALLTASCGASPAPAFHPSGSMATAGAGTVATPGSRTSTSADGVTWPPFGGKVRLVMPSWQPPVAGEVPAVVADKDFELAFLYSQYRGGQDDGWHAYAAPQVQRSLATQLAQPDVTTQSFTGTVRFSHLSAFPDPSITGAIDVAQCFDDSAATNTSLATGHPVPDRTPPDQHYYQVTNALARSASGNWQVVAMYQPVYYPRARECKP